MIINNKKILITCVFLQFDIESENPNYFICALNNDHIDEIVYLNTITKKIANKNSDLQSFANNVLFINDFLQQYYQFYHLLYQNEVFNLEENNILIVKRNFVQKELVNEEILIAPLVHPNYLFQYDNDDEKLFINNFADTFLCLRPNPSTKLLAEASLKAFLPKYPNQIINWNDIPANLRLKIEGLYEEQHLSEQFVGNLEPVYYNINDYVTYNEN
jgi:hypothetical protein